MAPSALRTPISRVRSVTDTSMMFMIPMPPTRRLTAAMLASSVVNTWVVCCWVARMSCWLRMVKSFSPPGRIWCSRRSTRSRSTMPCSIGTPSATCTDIERSRSVPKTRYLRGLERNEDLLVGVAEAARRRPSRSARR